METFSLGVGPTQTASIGTANAITFQGFDPSLGTLTSVTFALSASTGQDGSTYDGEQDFINSRAFGGLQYTNEYGVFFLRSATFPSTCMGSRLISRRSPAREFSPMISTAPAGICHPSQT